MKKAFLVMVALLSMMCLILAGCGGNGGGNPGDGTGDNGGLNGGPSDNPGGGGTPSVNADGIKAALRHSTRGTAVTEADDVYTITIGEGNGGGRWSDQIDFISDKTFAVDEYFMVTADVVASVEVTGVTYKGTNADANIELFYNGSKSTIGTTSSKIAYAGQAKNDAKPFYLLMDFGDAPAGAVITISNIKVQKVEDPTALAITGITASASMTEVATGGTVTLSAKDSNGFDVDATWVVSSGSSTVSGNTLTAAASAETVTVTASYKDYTDSVEITVVAPQDVVLYNSTDGVDIMGVWQNWYKGPTVSVSTDSTKTGIMMSFSDEGGSGGYELTNAVSFPAGAKLTMDVWADQNFKVKPVAPDEAIQQTLSSADIYEKVSVSIDLGEAGSLTQIGFICDVEDQVIYVDNIKVDMP